VGVASGLDALRLALEACGVGAGDEVIVPANTYIATWLAVSALGARPVPVEPDALTLLTKTAMRDIAHLLRGRHLAQLRSILDDPEASANDRFVALELLKNANIAAGGILPGCQDTGTAIVMGKKGQHVLTAGHDELAIARGVYDTYHEANLRYSQVAPLDMFEESNTGNNLPAQIDIAATDGDAYKFLFLAKGGGSVVGPAGEAIERGQLDPSRERVGEEAELLVERRLGRPRLAEARQDRAVEVVEAADPLRELLVERRSRRQGVFDAGERRRELAAHRLDLGEGDPRRHQGATLRDRLLGEAPGVVERAGSERDPSQQVVGLARRLGDGELGMGAGLVETTEVEEQVAHRQRGDARGPRAGRGFAVGRQGALTAALFLEGSGELQPRVDDAGILVDHPAQSLLGLWPLLPGKRAEALFEPA